MKNRFFLNRRKRRCAGFYLAFYISSGIIYFMTNPEEKPFAWLGSSKKDLMALPMGVRKFFGHALDFAQRGERHRNTKAGYGYHPRTLENRGETFTGDAR